MHGLLGVPDETAKPWTRTLPFAELTQFHIPSEYGELAMIGRWNESIQIPVLLGQFGVTIETS